MAKQPFTTGSILGDLSSYMTILAAFGFVVFPQIVVTSLFSWTKDSRLSALLIGFLSGIILATYNEPMREGLQQRMVPKPNGRRPTVNKAVGPWGPRPNGSR